MRKFNLSKHEMNLIIFSMGLCRSLIDQDNPELKQLGFTKNDVLGILEKLGMNPASLTSREMQRPENDWKEDNK